VLVDRQFQAPRENSSDAAFDAMACALGLDPDHQIVGLARKAQPPNFPFPIYTE
jgi:hypothetical protein